MIERVQQGRVLMLLYSLETVKATAELHVRQKDGGLGR